MDKNIKELLNGLQSTLIKKMTDSLSDPDVSSAQIMKEARLLLLDNAWTTTDDAVGDPLAFLGELAGDDADTLDKNAVPGGYLDYLEGKKANDKTG